MRAAAILGLGCAPKNLESFQSGDQVEWRIGLPASSDDADVVLLFGGDGTIHRHLAQLRRLGLPVLVVPAGSGNDFARALGLRRVRDAVAAWKQFCTGPANLRTIDLGVLTSVEDTEGQPHYFCTVAGVGLDAEVARRANRLPRWLRGHGGYFASAVPTVLTLNPLPVKLLTPPNQSSVPGSQWTIRNDQPTLLAAFANTPIYGGGMKIAPRAKMDDGLLDVCVVGGIDPFKLFCLFPSVYYGRHIDVKGVDYFQAARLRVETEWPMDVYADGEFVCQTPVEVSVERGALRVIAPLS
jgi:diacylglycerol kinase (ATP)